MSKDDKIATPITGNLKSLPGGVTELEKIIADMRKELPMIVELKKMQAQACRAYYLELVKQGFSEAEALTLAGQMEI
jgi:hypothetical protein